MTVIIGLTLGGEAMHMIPAGHAVLNLQYDDYDRANIPGAVFHVVGPWSGDVEGDGGGRAHKLVPVGDYTISVTHSGEAAIGDGPQIVTAESRYSYSVLFARQYVQDIQVKDDAI